MIIRFEKNDEKKIVHIKKKLLKKREVLKKDFFKKPSGYLTCKINSRMIDEYIIELYSILKTKVQHLPKQIIVCAVGGYGRKHLAPYSDIDLLFLHNSRINSDLLEEIIKCMLYPIWDLGLNVGHAVRSEDESAKLVKKNHVIKTSLLDARLICGSKSFFKRFVFNYKKDISSHAKTFFKEKVTERNKRLLNLNSDFFRNEPNIKENAGTIRDINLIFWVLRITEIFYSKKKLLFDSEYRKIKFCLNFFLTVRCFLHYLNKRGSDKLTFDYQKLIAEKIYTKNNSGLETKVEKLMKNFFSATQTTKNYVNIILNVIEEKILQRKITSFNLKANALNSQDFINMILFKISRGKLSHEEQRLVFDNNRSFNKKLFKSDKVISEFKKILFCSKDKGKLVLLNDLGLISKIIPQFARIVSLTQFDKFHSLTVDQHTLMVIDILKDIMNNNLSKGSYQHAKTVLDRKFNKKFLFYGALLHDIAKGKGGNHQTVGEELTKKILKSLKESKTLIRQTSWLVANHSLLSEYAFKKDFKDFSVIRRLIKKIKNIENLNSLYLLTIADISAVNQGLWTDWKALVLEKIYKICENEFSYPEKIMTNQEKIFEIKKSILSFSRKIRTDELRSFSKITDLNYWFLQSKKEITFQIENFFKGDKKKKDFNFSIRRITNSNIFDLTIVTNDRARLFSDIISVIASEKISILEARIFTLQNHNVVDTFKISFSNQGDINQNGTNTRLAKLKIKLANLEFNEPQRLKVIKRKKNFLKRKTDIFLDNNSSSTCSVLVVITNDRERLLYDLSNILIGREMIITMAKISTNGDYVEDSFHIRNKFNLKILEKSSINSLILEIKRKLEDF